MNDFTVLAKTLILVKSDMILWIWEFKNHLISKHYTDEEDVYAKESV